MSPNIMKRISSEDWTYTSFASHYNTPLPYLHKSTFHKTRTSEIFSFAVASLWRTLPAGIRQLTDSGNFPLHMNSSCNTPTNCHYFCTNLYFYYNYYMFPFLGAASSSIRLMAPRVKYDTLIYSLIHDSMAMAYRVAV